LNLLSLPTGRQAVPTEGGASRNTRVLYRGQKNFIEIG
jgi:hypothetical protein